MGNKWINYRLLVVCVLLVVAILGVVYVDRTSAEASQMIISKSVTTELGEVAYVPLANTNRLALIDTQTHALIEDIDTAQFGCTYPQRARLNPDGTELYLMCNSSQNIVVLKTLDLSLAATIDRPNTCLQDIAFVRFGDYALATTSNCYAVYQIDVIDTTTHTIVQSIPTQNILVISIDAHPFLPQAYAAGGEGYETGQVLTGHVLVINTDTFTIETMIPFGELIWDVQPSPDGQWVYASEAYDEGIAKIEVEHSEIVDFLPFNSIYGLDISPDGSVLYGSDSWNSQIAVFNTDPLEFITNISVGAATSEVEITCDGSELYVATDGTSIPVIDTATYTVSDDIPVPGNGSAFGIAICPQYVTKGIFLDPPDQIGYDRIGETISYTLQVSNQTGVTDRFNLGVLPGNHWTTSLSTGQVGPIQDGESISFTASVDISPDALPGEIDTAIIQATSVLSPAQFIDTALITTTAISNNLAYVTQSTDQLALIDRDLHAVVGNIDLAGMGCLGPWRPRLTPSGSTLYVLCSGSSNLIALTLPELSLSYTVSNPGGGEEDIVFDADESHAFISSRDQLGIRVLDIEAQAMYTMIFLPGEGIITSIEASPTGQFIYASGSWSGGGRVYVIDPEAFTVVSMIDFGSDVWDITAAADNQWLYASDRWGAGIAIIDSKTLQIVDVIQNTGELTGLALSADGETIFAGREFSGYVDAYDISSRSFITSIWLGGTVRDLTMDCTGEELYVAPSTNVVSVINTHTFNVDYSIPTPGTAYGVAICPQYLSNLVTHKTVDTPTSHPGALVNYQITASNLITESINSVVITDTLPLALTYTDGSLNATSGTANYQDGVITWTGSITASTAVTINFGARVSATAEIGTSITNEAVIYAEGKTYLRAASIDIELYRLYIPCASRACLPSYKDDFSNPASGWSIASGDGYWMGYQNGAYYVAVNQGWMAWSLRDFGVSDFQLAVDTWPGATLNGSAGLMFSVTEYGFYMFEVNDGWYSLWRNDAQYWHWTPLIDWTYSPAVHPGYQVNRLEVVRIGSNIKVYVNGQFLGSVNDGTYRGTFSGFASEAYTGYFDGRFDNVVMYTGPCIGTKSVALPINQAAIFDGIFIKPGTEQNWPMPIR